MANSKGTKGPSGFLRGPREGEPPPQASVMPDSGFPYTPAAQAEQRESKEI